jgi:hypothetical protein
LKLSRDNTRFGAGGTMAGAVLSFEPGYVRCPVDSLRRRANKIATLRNLVITWMHLIPSIGLPPKRPSDPRVSESAVLPFGNPAAAGSSGYLKFTAYPGWRRAQLLPNRD